MTSTSWNHDMTPEVSANLSVGIREDEIVFQGGMKLNFYEHLLTQFNSFADLKEFYCRDFNYSEN